MQRQYSLVIQMGTLSYQIAVILHVLAAIIWVGGVIFIASVALPSARELSEPHSRKVISGVGRRFRLIGWSALAVLVVSGTVMLSSRGATASNIINGSFFESVWGSWMFSKLGLVCAVLVVSGMHDWWIGPLASRRIRDGKNPRYWRIVAAVGGALNAILNIAVIVVAVYVARPHFY